MLDCSPIRRFLFLHRPANGVGVATTYRPIFSIGHDGHQAVGAISQHAMLIRGGKALNVVLGLFGVLLFAASSDVRALAISILAMSLSYWLRLRISLPPVLLLLSASTRPSILRHGLFKRFAAPLRVLSLLDMAGRVDKRLVNQLELDCLRTENDDDWWPVIQYISEISPFLVVDATATTTGVLREFRHIIESRLVYKSIFVTGPNGECDLVNQMIDSVAGNQSELCIVNENAALTVIDAWLTTGDLPTPNRPVHLLAFA